MSALLHARAERARPCARECCRRSAAAAQGRFHRLHLETAIDSTLPGMTTCITATDTFGVDGKVVLLERGTKLIGETRGQVQQGRRASSCCGPRRARPPASSCRWPRPGADELGRSRACPARSIGTSGSDSAPRMLISVIDGAVEAAVQSSQQRRHGHRRSVGLAGRDDRSAQGTINIPPTVTKQTATASRCWSRAIWISGRSMSCDPSRPCADRGRRDSSALALTLRALRPLLAEPERHGALHQSAREAFWNARRLAAASHCHLRISNGAVASRSWSRIRPSSASMRPRRCCPRRCRAASACRSSCRRRPRAGCVAITIRRPADQVWSIESWRARDLSAHPPRRPRRSTRPRRSCCACWRSRLRGLHAPRRAQPQEHPGVRPHRVRQDHLDQGADSGNSDARSD